MKTFFTFLLCLSSFLTFAQAVFFKSVKIETLTEYGKTYYDVIAVTFYRNGSPGFELFSHSGNLISKVDIRSVRASEKPLDQKIIPLIEKVINEREKDLKQSEAAQKILAVSFLTVAKLSLPFTH